jgi:hypothetical protein
LLQLKGEKEEVLMIGITNLLMMDKILVSATNSIIAQNQTFWCAAPNINWKLLRNAKYGKEIQLEDWNQQLEPRYPLFISWIVKQNIKDLLDWVQTPGKCKTWKGYRAGRKKSAIET